MSETALDVTKKRLGLLAEQVTWIVADITQVHFESFAYDVWHDRGWPGVCHACGQLALAVLEFFVPGHLDGFEFGFVGSLRVAGKTG